MRILFASSEATPFAKTGGLADVAGALPRELAALGNDVLVIMPAFRQIWNCGRPIEETGLSFDVPIGNKIVPGRLLRGTLPHSDVPVFFVAQDTYYDRPELYREAGEDYQDNCERFVFFSRAVMEAVLLLGGGFDLIHCNDWQTGLIPAYLKLEFNNTRGYQSVASVFTIHNLAYQGRFWRWDMLLTGLDWRYFNHNQMEFWGDLNLLKTGIVFADGITTVSNEYAREIQVAPLGCGLEGVLHERSDALQGILNGVDYGEWNPETDSTLAQTYRVDDWQTGKAACKAALQRELGLPERPEVPLVGLIGRLADQKGWDLVSEVMERWGPDEDVQWAILGTGEPHYHSLLESLAGRHGDKFAVRLTFSNDLAHRIEAGSDMFLMPSRYEPCGLNQMYSLRYGTLPIVRRTGGLADTIFDANAANLDSGRANGFSFDSYDWPALEATLRRACTVYRTQPEVWEQLVGNAMRQDWSWGRSAREYVEFYGRAIERQRLQSAS